MTLEGAARQIGLSVWAYRRIETGETQEIPLSIAIKIEDWTKRKVKLRDLLINRAA